MPRDFGPWIEGLTPGAARTLAMPRGAGDGVSRAEPPPDPSLRPAEVEPNAARRALVELDALAPRIRRRLLAIYGAIHDRPGGVPRAHT
jgi:hypothetical protein